MSNKSLVANDETGTFSLRLALYIIAICWVVLNTGCGNSSSSDKGPAPLNSAQKQSKLLTVPPAR